MNHEKWNEDKIEELLKNAPKIHDTRSKEEVFERLKQDGLFDEEPPKKTSRKKINIIPGLIAACAVLFLAILIPPFMKEQKTEEATTAGDMDATNSMEMEMYTIPEMRSGEEYTTMMATEPDIKTSVYPEQLEGNTLFRIGLASDAASSIPVTILIPNEIVMEDLGKNNPTEVELYNEYAPRLNEKLLGFKDYHPYVGEISEQNNKVIHKLPNNHPYDEASATLTTYYASLTDTFSSYERIEFVDEQNQPIIFKEVGEENPLLINDESKQYSYYKYVQEDGAEFLAPNFRKTHSTVEEALEALKVNTNDIYQSVILPGVDYSVKVEGEIVTVTLEKELNLFDYNQVEAMQMIEAILLTAAGFDKSVQFENIVQTEWEGFDFTKPLPIPVGPNELPYTVLENN
ncbi:MAG: hypothetical protein GX072_13095 [Lysinibacillus sp.]|nr:hypothetical protein [Lysinibacillus sp.]